MRTAIAQNAMVMVNVLIVATYATSAAAPGCANGATGTAADWMTKTRMSDEQFSDRDKDIRLAQLTNEVAMLRMFLINATASLRELHDFAIADSHYRYNERSEIAFERAAEWLGVIEPMFEKGDED